MLETRYGLDLDPGRARIAVIDDDMVFVDLMHDLLANGEGYEVVSNSTRRCWKPSPSRSMSTTCSA